MEHLFTADIELADPAKEMIQSPPQIATVVIATSGIHYALLLLAAASACVYILVWSQGLQHYSVKFTHGDTGRLKHILPLSVLEYNSQCFEYSLKAAWRLVPAVIVRLPTQASTVKSYMHKFTIQLAKYGDHIGPANSCGLRRPL